MILYDILCVAHGDFMGFTNRNRFEQHEHGIPEFTLVIFKPYSQFSTKFNEIQNEPFLCWSTSQKPETRARHLWCFTIPCGWCFIIPKYLRLKPETCETHVLNHADIICQVWTITIHFFDSLPCAKRAEISVDFSTRVESYLPFSKATGCQSC